MVHESRTSRLCARCFTPFPLETLSHRFKVCEWCVPDQNEWPDGLKLPTKIVSMKSKRTYQMERRERREAIIANPNQAVGSVSKMICYRKNWQQNELYDVDGNDAQRPDFNINGEYDYTADYVPDDWNLDEPILKTIWHRDISAAKLILYKGKSN